MPGQRGEICHTTTVTKDYFSVSVRQETARELDMVGTAYFALVFTHNRTAEPDLIVTSSAENCRRELGTHLTTTFMLSSGDTTWFLTGGWLPSSRRSASPLLK